MRGTHGLALVIALSGPSALFHHAQSGELVTPAPAQAIEFLVPAAELGEVNLSIVDDKLAMSLAVEAHLQIELTEFALASITDPQLKAHTEEKLRSYRQLYETLNELCGGRPNAMLGRVAKADDEEAGPAGGDASGKKRKRGGGIGDILQNTATKAILKVRLEIAQQYTDMLRAELELSPPGEFDRRYIGIEVYNQMQVLAMLRVFEEQASKEFGRLIHVATVATEGHLVNARTVIDQLKNTLPIPVAKEQVVNTADTLVK
jgi:hypothetical protein